MLVEAEGGWPKDCGFGRGQSGSRDDHGMGHGGSLPGGGLKHGEQRGGDDDRDLSRRSGVPVKTLREYEDLGLIYTVGRSAGNYRLFDSEALWCVEVVGALRSLGLTLAEITELP
ncbi:MAG TPA: MerR family transcriptional regulator [Actinocrinis sp.]|jgi:hypothetical protein